MSRKARTDENGIRWGRQRASKRVFTTPHDALVAAFAFFAVRGVVTTPYRCGRFVAGIGEVRWRVTGNPWASAPFRFSIAMRRTDVAGCREWHLTSSTAHLLPRTESLLQQ